VHALVPLRQVRKWRREWQPAGGTYRAKRLLFCKWVSTGDRDTAPPQKRRPDIVALQNPGGALVPDGFRPPAVQEGRPAPKIRLRIAGSGGSAAAAKAVAAGASGAASPEGAAAAPGVDAT
jgi:hypothetical protein